MRIVKLVAACLLCAALFAPVAGSCEMSATDRRLNTAVLGFAFNAQTADAALAAGGAINHRNEAYDNDTMLMDAVRGFKDVAAVRWLLDHGADPALRNAQGKTALDFARQLNIGSRPEGRAVLTLLETAAGGAPAPAAGNAAAAAPKAAVAAAPKTAAAPPAPAVTPAAKPAPKAVAAVAFGPVAPGVYDCINQQAIASPIAFGIIDGANYMSSGGRRGRYAYDAATGVLTLDPGGEPARYRRISETTFRLMLPSGELGGFTCPLNRAKNPQRPPW